MQCVTDNPGERRPSSQTAFLGMMLALSIALHTVEKWMPTLVVPGAKIGLANIVSLVVLLGYGWRNALLIVILRQVAGSVLGGTFLTPGFIIGLSGGIAGILIMQAALLPSSYFRCLPWSVVGISCLGATGHNVGQMGAAVLLFHDGTLWRYLPLLMMLAIPSGVFTGMAGNHLLKLLSHTAFAPVAGVYRIAETLRFGDWIAAALILLTGSTIYYVPYVCRHGQPIHATVATNGSVWQIIYLDKDQLIALDMPMGRMVLEVKDRRICVKESLCRHKTCVLTGWIEEPGQMITCLPNHTVVCVSGDEIGRIVDAVSY